jgi:hypothetical protein
MDYDNMKRFILEKRAKDSDSLDEYSDIFSNKHNNNIYNKFDKLISNAANVLAFISLIALLFTLISQSLISALTLSLSRSYTLV